MERTSGGDGSPTSPVRRPRLHTWLIRSLRLRCPRCGARGILASWFELAEECPRCGLDTDRGEEGHFLGAMLLSLVAVELVVAALGALTIVVAWPAVPWNAITIGGVILAVGMPVGLYPFSRLLWLGVDLHIRPEVD